MSSTESMARFYLAIFIAAAAVSYQNYIILFLSVMLIHTAIKRRCFLYSIFNINRRFSIENYFKSLLPDNNPSSVYIFNNKGEMVFANSVAEEEFSEIESVCQFGINKEKVLDLIPNDEEDIIIYEANNKTYQVNLKGYSEEDFIFAYFIDISEVIDLNKEIEKTQSEIIYTMGEVGETRSKETGQHVKRVALYSKLLATAYGLSDEEAEILEMASPMHDIGKVGIPDAVLNKPDKLDKQEFDVMKTHAKLGYEMLNKSNKPILQAAAIVAHEHHEKFDGTGYPRGLKGDDIHIYGRITAIADVFDALGSDRVYKKAWALDDILELFKNESGKHFDPKLVELFMENLDKILLIRDTHKDTL
jgi:response regulator RpfG family c-di-GMP phosphodiesterase